MLPYICTPNHHRIPQKAPHTKMLLAICQAAGTSRRGLSHGLGQSLEDVVLYCNRRARLLCAQRLQVRRRCAGNLWVLRGDRSMGCRYQITTVIPKKKKNNSLPCSPLLEALKLAVGSLGMNEWTRTWKLLLWVI